MVLYFQEVDSANNFLLTFIKKKTKNIQILELSVINLKKNILKIYTIYRKR